MQQIVGVGIIIKEKIALYYGIRKINELITIGKACDIEKYAIEIEWKEDFSYCIYRR